ncbi:acyl-CoA carboxylase subunit beta [Kibdelosporangium aridum]|uniref:acyl-CoA carboxylase subunit beta n=1 Tax=Kibdelosporangium aridum TaxID=2030 RepID=UPI000B25D48E
MTELTTRMPQRSEWAAAAVSALAATKAARHSRELSAADRQHARGKLTPRERIALLLDPGTFVEVGGMVRHRSTVLGLGSSRPLGDAVITGHGTVDGRPVCVFAQDFTVFGGSLGEVVGEKIVKIMDMAQASEAPVVGINDSAGGRIQEGVVAQALYGEIFARNVRMSGSVPQISLILGPCAGGACYSPALTDFIVMADRSAQMFITGPSVLQQAVGEQVDAEELGGAHAHGSRSGVAHHVAATEADAIDYVRRLLSYVPARKLDLNPWPDAAPDPYLATVLPGPDEPYDIRQILDRILDDDGLLEVHSGFAPNIVVGFGRIGGHGVGIVANQPAVANGRLDSTAAEKAARFVRTCDAYGIPIVSFVDTPGFAGGVQEEWNGGARRGAALLYAYAEATVPMLTVLVRHADGIGYVAMGSRHLGADACLAWPTARIDSEEPYPAAERGYVDDVIDPADTRATLQQTLRLVAGKKATRLPRRHGNLPL